MLHFSADSVIYLFFSGDVDVDTGEFLGDMMDELPSYGTGAYIDEFVGCGPKQYAFRIVDAMGKRQLGEMLKIRGIRFDYTASQVLDFEIMHDMATSFALNSLIASCTIVQNCIRRKCDHTLVTRQCIKDYKIVYDKCCILHNYSTLPYGF